MDVLAVTPAEHDIVETCARMMIASEPWVTLERTFDSAVQALQDPGKELHVVLDQGTVAAFVLLDMRGPLAGYIQSICVRPDQRAQGRGSALLAWAEQRIFKDSPNVFMCVSSFNTGAQRLYERRGYAVVGRFACFVVHEHDELLLRKTRGPWARFAPSVSAPPVD